MKKNEKRCAYGVYRRQELSTEGLMGESGGK